MLDCAISTKTLWVGDIFFTKQPFPSHGSHAMVQISKKFQRKFVIIFLLISLNMCFGCSKEPSYQDGSFEHPQHMFWLRNKNCAFLSVGLVS